MKATKRVLLLFTLVVVCAVLSACGEKDQYEKGLGYLNSCDLAAALNCFENAPDYLDAAAYIRYTNARLLFAGGDLGNAITAFEELGSFRDSSDFLEEARERLRSAEYEKADGLLRGGDPDAALEGFSALGSYRDSERCCAYLNAFLDERGGAYEAAAAAYRKLGAFRDSLVRAAACEDSLAEGRYSEAERHLMAGEYEAAADLYAQLGGYRDASLLLTYTRSELLGEQGEWDHAISGFDSLGDLRDSALMALYYSGRKAEGEGRFKDACGIYLGIYPFRDSADRYAYCGQELRRSGLWVGDDTLNGLYEIALKKAPALWEHLAALDPEMYSYYYRALADGIAQAVALPEGPVLNRAAMLWCPWSCLPEKAGPIADMAEVDPDIVSDYLERDHGFLLPFLISDAESYTWRSFRQETSLTDLEYLPDLEEGIGAVVLDYDAMFDIAVLFSVGPSGAAEIMTCFLGVEDPSDLDLFFSMLDDSITYRDLEKLYLTASGYRALMSDVETRTVILREASTEETGAAGEPEAPEEDPNAIDPDTIDFSLYDFDRIEEDNDWSEGSGSDEAKFCGMLDMNKRIKAGELEGKVISASGKLITRDGVTEICQENGAGGKATIPFCAAWDTLPEAGTFIRITGVVLGDRAYVPKGLLSVVE